MSEVVVGGALAAGSFERSSGTADSNTADSTTAVSTTVVSDNPAPIDIVLIDDHAIVRDGLRAILERECDLRVVGEAATTEAALKTVRQVRPQIVLLDLKLSAGSDTEGLELCAALIAEHPGLGVLVLTTFIDDHLVLAAIHNGARGYVVKDVDTSALIRAIRDISHGGSAFDARSAAAMVRGIHSGSQESDKKLTGREQEVLELLSRGMSNVEIGKKLFISDTTVKFHVGNILRKLGVTRRAEAVHLAGKMGLI